MDGRRTEGRRSSARRRGGNARRPRSRRAGRCAFRVSARQRGLGQGGPRGDRALGRFDRVGGGRAWRVEAVMELAQFLHVVPRGDLWVFGYGSLMWSPEFAFEERRPGLIHGYHRALCILSSRYRGTPKKPGLVMGLCRGGSCWGMAFRVHNRRAKEVLDALWKREMLNNVYLPKFV